MDLKQKTIFDILNDITFNKVKWEEQDQKQVQTYMLNRWLSMSDEYLDIIAYCQPTTDLLTPELYYKFYVDLLPKRKFFTKYISGKKESSYSEPLLIFLCQRLELGIKEVEEMLMFLTKEQIREYIRSFGYDDKKMKQEFSI